MVTINVMVILWHKEDTNMKCEWSRHGYCEYYSTAEEQEQRETNWPCDGSEDEMQDCGMSRKEEDWQ